MKLLVKHKQNIICTLVFVLLCIIDQRKGSAGGETQLISTNCMGLCIAALVLSHYKFKDFLQKKYLVWTLLSTVAGTIITLHVYDSLQYKIQWYTAMANVYVLGLLTIRTICSIRERGRVFTSSKRIAILLTGTLLLMGLSLNDSLWPWWYLWLFGLVCLTDFSDTERNVVWNSMQNGIILSFFLIQGCAFVFRPYDRLRYLGMYANTNMNALFYTVVYCAFLGKLCYLLFFSESRFKKFWVVITLAFCGAMWSFVFLTICRSAMVSMAVATAVAGIYCMKQFRRLFLVKSMSLILGLLLCVIISFPIVYSAVRYLPAVFHHPIWFVNEYNVNKVHSYDPYDSEKYISITEFLEGAFGRFGVEFLESISEQSSIKDTEFEETFIWLADIEAVDAGSLRIVSTAAGYMPLFVVSGTADALGTPDVLLPSGTGDSVAYRKSIYRYYFENLNLLGHKSAENGVQVTKWYYAPHAHNLYLQMAFDFGIPVGILFLVLIGVVVVIMVKGAFSRKDKKSFFFILPLLYYINILAFSMFEITWVNGQLTFALLFLLPALLQEMPKVQKEEVQVAEWEPL